MRTLLPLVLFLLAIPALSQSSLADGLKVNGVGLGAKYQDVIKKLGKPTQSVTSKKLDQCIGSYVRTMTYPGLKLELDDTGGGYTVFSFEVRSGPWNVSGVRIGDAGATVQKTFGTRGRTVEKRKGNPAWYYEMTEDNPGSSNFYFRGGKLVEIQSTYQMC